MDRVLASYSRQLYYSLQWAYVKRENNCQHLVVVCVIRVWSVFVASERMSRINKN